MAGRRTQVARRWSPDKRGRIRLSDWTHAQRQLSNSIGVKRMTISRCVMDALRHHPRGATDYEVTIYIVQNYGIRNDEELRRTVRHVLEMALKDDWGDVGRLQDGRYYYTAKSIDRARHYGSYNDDHPYQHE